VTTLEGRWRHSFEEDHEGIRVYRPDDYDFPPSRRRGGVEFGADGTFIDWGPAAPDVNGRPGSWTVDEAMRQLELTIGDWHRVIEVVCARADRLELRIRTP
jgi:hypothetical protein